MAFLSFKEILELIDKVADRELGGVEIESGGVRVKIDGKRNDFGISSFPPQFQQSAGLPASFQPVRGSTGDSMVEAASTPPRPVTGEEVDESWHVITSPIVGTFYRAANPEAEFLVNAGDSVSKGKVLCIIEAMKLMNEIESDVDGVIVKIFPQNGQPVEYGEKLFAVKM